MTLFDYFLVFWFALSALTVIAGVGKPREHIAPATAVASTIIISALIVGLLFSRGVF